MTKKILTHLLTIAAILSSLLTSASPAQANIFNKFRKGFYFEKYSTVEEAKEEILKLHPIGSDADELIKTLERAGCKCKIIDNSKLEAAKKVDQTLKNVSEVFHCENLINLVVWRISLMVAETKIHNIGINKEYMGL